MEALFVFDIDSTLADDSHRTHFLEKRCNLCLHTFKSDLRGPEICNNCGGDNVHYTSDSWNQFTSDVEMAKDKPIKDAIKALMRLRELGASICFLTGRIESTMGAMTYSWLRDHAGWQGPGQEPIFMRQEEDLGLPASVYKERAVKRLKDSLDKEYLLFFFEDDPHVFRVYNKHGICIQAPMAFSYFMPAGLRGGESAWSR